MQTFSLGPWTVHPALMRATGPSTVGLSPNESDLLAYLHGRAEGPVPRETLLVEVFGYAPGIQSRAVDSTMSRLRKKLEVDGFDAFVVTRGRGVSLAKGAEPPVAVSPPGRQALVVQILEALGGPGLTTLTGPVGIGKSVVARAVCAQRQGVWVRLVDAHSETELLACLSAELQSAHVEDALVASLSRGVLWVLDGCGELDPPARARITSWARSGTVLATSSSALQLGSERRIPVPPLDDVTAMQVLDGHLERAGLDAEPALKKLAIARIGGLPLGLRIVAPSLGLFGKAALQDLLQHRDGAVDTPERHQSLGAAVRRSLHGLPDETREVLTLLCGFSGTFRVQEALGIVGEGSSLLPSLSALHQRGLVLRQDQDFRVLPLVRSTVLDAGDLDLEAWMQRFRTLLPVLVQAKMQQGPKIALQYRPGLTRLLPTLRADEAKPFAVLVHELLPTLNPALIERLERLRTDDADLHALLFLTARAHDPRACLDVLDALPVSIWTWSALSLCAAQARCEPAQPLPETAWRQAEPYERMQLVEARALGLDAAQQPALFREAQREATALGWTWKAEGLAAALGTYLTTQERYAEAVGWYRTVPPQRLHAREHVSSVLAAWGAGDREAALAMALRAQTALDERHPHAGGQILRAVHASLRFLEGDSAFAVGEATAVLADSRPAKLSQVLCLILLRKTGHSTAETPDPGVNAWLEGRSTPAPRRSYRALVRWLVDS